MINIYKLTEVVKITARENFDRASIEGDNFEFINEPEVGDRFIARDLKDGQYLTTSPVDMVSQTDKIVVITTGHTRYTFEAVE